MFEVQQKYTGTSYTTVAALLAVAVIFVPTVLVLSRPFTYLFLFLAIACSAFCVILAYRLWKKLSRLSIPSIAIQKGRAK